LRLVLQRVQQASVEVEGDTVGAIGAGLLVFLGIGQADVSAVAGETRDVAHTLARKVATLRIFPDKSGRSNLSLLDTGGSALVISQFTLYADTRRGRRPSFTDAAEPGLAEELVEGFRHALEALGVPTASGRFGAHMCVALVNDGPYTVVLDSED
jgi:D-tyrosyl-tRNA(Tyr) deacylase